MPNITVAALRCRIENDIEHEVAFDWGGRRLVARALLMAVDDPAWRPGALCDVKIRLVRGGQAMKIAPHTRPQLEDEGEAMWSAVGPVLAIDGDLVTIDVGFPLEVDLDRDRRQPELTPDLVEGDSLAVRGELRVGLLADE